MADMDAAIILKDDVFALTIKGKKELSEAATLLTAAELRVLVLLDGISTAAETANRVPNLQSKVVMDILCELYREGLIEFVQVEGGSLDFVNFLDTLAPREPSAADTAKAEKAAAATTTLLFQQGYVVRIARRATGKGKANKSQPISVLVIEDEEILANLLKVVLEAEGYQVRIAMNRKEISAAFSQPPVPNLVLLDLMLPSLDGFEILLKIRQHPNLKALPVVILTAKTTREAVLRGLACGADGYLTKPFDIPVLMKAVRAVLGQE